MKADELVREGAEYKERYEEESEDSFVMVKERKTFNRIIEEGIYNIKESDYEGTNSRLKDTPVVVGIADGATDFDI